MNVGIALLYYHLSQIFSDQRNEYLSKAKDLVRKALGHADHRVVTFICGEPGALAIAAVLSHHFGDEKAMKKYIEK